MKSFLFYAVLTFLLCTMLRAQVSVQGNAQVVISPFQYNGPEDDFAPALAQDGKLLLFTQENDKTQRIMLCERDGQGWASPTNLGSEVNDAIQAGSASVTSDGQFIVFAAYKHSLVGFGRTDLYSARKVNGKWTDVRNLGAQVNSEAFDSQPALSPDGSTLYFVSDRSGGAGGTDIYVCHRRGKDWTKAELVGSGVNTSSDELTPSLAADNSTLYFASNRSGGQGGFDIYTTRYKAGTYSTPTNIGAPINSSADEYNYCAVPNSTKAYFASNRSGGQGGIDIYMADPNPEMPDAVLTMHGIVSDANSGKPLGADLVVTDLKTRQKVAILHSDDQSGEYYVTLNAGHSYSITATRPDYVFYSERVDVPVAEKGRTVNNDIKLTPLANDAETRLLIFFDTDKAELSDESMPELDRAVEFLQANPDIRVRIEGHTDDVGEDNYNLQLSQRRADAVKTYITQQGIEQKRVLTVGYGKTRPKVKGTTEEARSQNRRVEMKILK